ncbi:MAG: amidohydrolase family protein [Dehalococcoidia bacterium]|nr:amidohydrolase family protein [Dehalococcoidia bacterium]
MIIDIHTHLMSEEDTPRTFWDNWVKVSSAHSGVPQERIRERLPRLYDTSGEKLIQEMDEAGIDRSVIALLDFWLIPETGTCKLSIEELNLRLANIAKRYPDRLIAFAGIDPRRKNAVDLLETAVKEWGVKGLKLFPATGFYPQDRQAYPLYRSASQFGIPVLFHSGPQPAPFYSKYCQPVYLDEVATDFPELNIIIAHVAHGWWPEAVSIAGSNPNIYVDISGWQPLFKRHPKEFFHRLREVVDGVGSRRVLFGSDWPVLKLLVSQEKWVKAFSVSAAAEYGVEFSEQEIELILAQNSVSLLGLTGTPIPPERN